MIGPKHRGRHHIRKYDSESWNENHFRKPVKQLELAAIHVWRMINNEGFEEIVWLEENVNS